MDVEGVWLFRVGDLRGENVQVPGSRTPDTSIACAIVISLENLNNVSLLWNLNVLYLVNFCVYSMQLCKEFVNMIDSKLVTALYQLYFTSLGKINVKETLK